MNKIYYNKTIRTDLKFSVNIVVIATVAIIAIGSTAIAINVKAQNTTNVTANYNSMTGQQTILSQFEQSHNSSNSKTNNLFIPNHKGDLTPDELKHQQAICDKAFKTNPYTAILIGCTSK